MRYKIHCQLCPDFEAEGEVDADKEVDEVGPLVDAHREAEHPGTAPHLPDDPLWCEPVL